MVSCLTLVPYALSTKETPGSKLGAWPPVAASAARATGGLYGHTVGIWLKLKDYKPDLFFGGQFFQEKSGMNSC